MTKRLNESGVSKEFEAFIEDCARCPECVINDEFAVCSDHSDEWNQVYKHHWEYLQLQEIKSQ